MHYRKIVEGVFSERPNRFIAYVRINGKTEICHVKNTGRCKELLVPGAKVILEEAENPNRKTKYDLIAVYKENMLINMDSSAPNKAAAEFLPILYPKAKRIKAEVKHKNSRFDFCVEEESRRIWVEVKGVTLEENGVVLFPDAPTERGVKHLSELIECVKEGDSAQVLFVVQMENACCFVPNEKTHPAFAKMLRQAKEAGVIISAYSCKVTPQSMELSKPVLIKL